MADDFRIHIHTSDPGALLERLGGTRDESGRFSVSHDGDDVFVYANTYAEAQRAATLIGGEHRIERWLEQEERWDDEAPDETWEQEELDEGYAPWEVRVDAGSRGAARELAEQLESEGYRPVRQWSFVIVGTASREDADALAARLHGSVEAGGELVWETMPGNPFAVFGGMGTG
ncbi:MAG: SPOR domain-containing protein [Actinomycetota bacterium]